MSSVDDPRDPDPRAARLANGVLLGIVAACVLTLAIVKCCTGPAVGLRWHKDPRRFQRPVYAVMGGEQAGQEPRSELPTRQDLANPSERTAEQIQPRTTPSTAQAGPASVAAAQCTPSESHPTRTPRPAPAPGSDSRSSARASESSSPNSIPQVTP